MYGKGLRTLSIATVVTLAAGLCLVFFYAPLDANQGFIQKIFYLHVPLAMTALIGFIVGGLFAIAHLRSGDRRWDAYSYVSIHISVIFGVAVLITGSIWAKASWGHWWVWEEPTLVSFLIVFLLYATYYPFRYAIEDPERQARYASVFAVTAGAFVPLNFLAVRLTPSLVHPRVFATANGGLPNSMLLTFLVCLAAIALLWVTLVKFELTAKSASGQVKRLRRALDAPAPGSQVARRPGGELSARPPPRRSRQVRRRRLHRLPRPDRRLRRDHGGETPADRAGAARVGGVRGAADAASGSARRSAAVSELLTLGVSHKTAPLDLRERLSLTEGRAVGALRELTAAAGIHEAAAISTCNRTELYLVVSDPVEAESTALGVLTRQAEIRPTELLGHLYSLRSTDAARHLFRVTSGLDSMIVGEAEVQGQVKRAYELALVEGGTGPILNRLFRGALAAGGRAREETGISEKGVSISSVAVELAQRTLGDLTDRRVLVIGAGETAELVARALVARGVATVFVANRRYDRAIGLAQRFGGGAVRFEELPEQLEAADIVVSATNSPHHIVERDDIAQVMATREGRPLLLVDIAVPRDVEPACREVAGVSLHDIDDVQQIVERNASGREAEAKRAEPIIEAEVDRFERWLASLEVVPTIVALRERSDEIVRRVLAENDPRWESLGEADRERLATMAKAIASRLLHEPTLRMKRAAGSDDAYLYVSALRELFGLDARDRAGG